MAANYHIVLIEEFLDSDNQSPQERLQIYNGLLDADILREEVVPAMIELRQNLIRFGDVNILNMLDAMDDIYDLQMPIHKKPTGYEDTQNVHVFMEDCLQLADWLVKTFPTPYTRDLDCEFSDFIERHTDEFTYENNSFRLVDVFASLLAFIEQSADKEELQKILQEEMRNSDDTCVGGHLSRMVNSIRGFPGVPFFPGNKFEHAKAKLFHELNSALKFDDPNTINEQIQTYVNTKMTQVYPEITKILQAYTGDEWVVQDGKVKVKGPSP
jgi:hypothetical protein